MVEHLLEKHAHNDCRALENLRKRRIWSHRWIVTRFMRDPLKHVLVVVGTILTCGGLALTSTVALAATPAKKLSPLQRGLDYYRGKTVTFIAPTSAGSAFDVMSRAMTTEMGQYLGATINVLNNPAGGNVTGQDQIAQSVPNGLTIGYFNTATVFYDTITNAPSVNFNLKNAAFLGCLPDPVSFLQTLASSPYSSFASLLHSFTTSDPAKILASPGLGAAETLLLTKIFGIPAVMITDYNSSVLEETGFLRGDSNLAAIGTQFTTELESGIVRALVTYTSAAKIPIDAVPYSIIKSVPTLVALVKKYPPKTATEKAAAKYEFLATSVPNNVFGAPSATPSYMVDALDAAVKFAIRSNYVKTRLVAVGLLTGYRSPRDCKAAYATPIDIAPKIAAFING